MIKLIEVEDFTRPIEEQVNDPKAIYVKWWSDGTGTSKHICPCGCGTIWTLPVVKSKPRADWWKSNIWELYEDEEGITRMNPSIQQNAECMKHYWLKQGQWRMYKQNVLK